MIVTLATDLFFASRIAEVARTLGREHRSFRDVDSLLGAAVVPAIVFVDLQLRDADAIHALHRLRSALPGVRIVSFFPHVHDELGESARAAGSDLVLTRGQLSKQLPALISG
jgi:hypothetical protein